jgi:ribosomal protein S18 acetylase RimI-like enzyme
MRVYVGQTYGWEDADQRQRFREAFASRRFRVLVDDAGGIVASFFVEVRSKEHFLSSIEVAAGHRSCGIGSALVHRFVRAAHDAGVKATLQVLKTNPRARELYARLGFVVTGETATHVAMQIEPA